MQERLSVVDKISMVMTKEDRIVREGKVAVVYRPSGWVDFHDLPSTVSLDPELVVLMETKEKLSSQENGYVLEKISDYLAKNYRLVLEDVSDMVLTWIPQNSYFVTYWTGLHEVLIVHDNISWTRA